MTDAITILRPWVTLIELLPESLQLAMYRAICRYALDGTEPSFDYGDAASVSIFETIRPELRKSAARRAAQQIGVQRRLQNQLQKELQKSPSEPAPEAKTAETPPQTQLQTDLQTPLQTASQPKKKEKEPKRQKETPKETITDVIAKKAALLPPHLQCDAFRDKYLEWEAYRRKKRKPISPLAFSRQLNMLSRLTLEQAIEAIDTSIANDYQGLFPPRGAKAAPQVRKDYSGV